MYLFEYEKDTVVYEGPIHQVGTLDLTQYLK